MRDKAGFVVTSLYFVSWNFSIVSSVITIDPPTDLHITDLGRLGQLHIGWTLPSSLENLTSCSVRFQLQYLNTYKDRWTTVRTTQQWYRAQFNLAKDVHVRVWTLLKGPCTNNTELQSPPVEVMLQPQDEGTGSQVTGFGCVFHEKEYMDCTWQERISPPSHPQIHLFFWHKNMAHTMECPEYMLSNGMRTGCRFQHDVLLEFSDFNILVNGSSADGPLKPAYFSLEIQNHVKPAVIETVELETLPDGNITVWWLPSGQRIPDFCLAFEVESRQEDTLGEKLEYHITRETTYTCTVLGWSRSSCFRVRSRLHEFCADSSFWSEWSHARCLPGVAQGPETNALMNTVLPCILAVTMITFVVAVLLLWTCRTVLKKESWLHSTKWIQKGVFGLSHSKQPCSMEKVPFQFNNTEIQPFQQTQSV